MGKTRLQLLQRFRQEARVPGSSSDPTSALNQTGEYLKLVNWLDDAYESVQELSVLWQFLRKSFSVSLTSGTSEYTPTALGLTDHATWILDDVRCYLTAFLVTDEQEIFFVPWEEFKRSYLFGSAQQQTGRPIQFTIKPDKSIQFWPIPDDAYTCTGEYYRTPVVFTDDSKEPIFPDRFHMILVWRALMNKSADYAENDRYVHGNNEYEKIKKKLLFDQTPKPGWGPPLA